MKINLLVLLLVPQLIFAQSTSLWKERSSSSSTDVERWSNVKANRCELNADALVSLLKTVKKNGGINFPVPHPKGGEMIFNVRPTNIMAKKLQEKFPDIKTYSGVNEKGDRVRIDVNSKGVNAIVFSEEGMMYLDPVTRGGKEYLSYYASDYRKENPIEEPSLADDLVEPERIVAENKKGTYKHNSFRKRTVGTHLRKYRIAIVARQDYTAFHGGKKGAMEAIVTLVNRLTGIFEVDMGITLELIGDNDKIIFDYTDSPLDVSVGMPYSENTELINDYIGVDNYDIGHIFAGSGGGGIAAGARVCVTRKGNACSNSRMPIGDNFLTLVAHEMGHQFGSRHTFSAACAGGFDQRISYEIGAGTTLMTYAGICGGNQAQPYVDQYFHAASIGSILRYLIDDIGTCATMVPINNTPPTVSVPESGFTIPINTPFVLEASGQDADGNRLTYCWEQMDQTTKSTGENSPGYKDQEEMPEGVTTIEEYREYLTAQGYMPELIEMLIMAKEAFFERVFEGNGPLFRSFPPTTNNKRYFPSLDLTLSGDTSRFEVLPFKTRDLSFAVTLRDNVGGMTNGLITFSSTANAGPFVVTSKVSNSPYNGSSIYKVEWDVANTDKAPVSCAKVNILLSDNGGESFDYILLENTDNDGAENVDLPNIETSKARIMVEAADNIFFNVNDADFQIVPVNGGTPAIPTELAGTMIDEKKVELTWKKNSTNDLGFTIERKVEGSSKFEIIGETLPGVTTYTDNTIEKSVTYSYRVAAFNAEGNSAYSNIITLTNIVAPEVMEAPEALVGQLSGDNKVELSWKDKSTNEAGFIIERKTEGSSKFEKIGETGADIATYTDNSIEKSVTYSYRVAAFNAEGNSAYSNIITLTNTVKPEVLEAPEALVGQLSGDNKVELSWKDKSTNEAGFIIERKTEGSSKFEKIGETGADIATYTDNSIEKLVTYSYRVAAFNAEGTSAYSNIITMTSTEMDEFLQAPGALVGQLLGGNKIELLWTDNSNNETGFIIERKVEDNSDFEKIGESAENTTVYSDNDIAESVTYSYRVAAFNKEGVSKYSNVISLVHKSLSTYTVTGIEVLYPNPAKDYIFLPASLAKKTSRIAVFNLAGAKVMDLQVDKSVGKIDVSGLKNGLYFMRIYTSEQEMVKKFYKE